MVPAVIVEPGLVARVSYVVAEIDTAMALGTGEVPVLATPKLITLCDMAIVKALHGMLPDKKTHVGGRVQFDHLAPVAVGTEVTAEAVLERVEGRRLTFTVSASDTSGLVGAGRITRVVVDQGGFLSSAR